jgi:hypothetical protein
MPARHSSRDVGRHPTEEPDDPKRPNDDEDLPPASDDSASESDEDVAEHGEEEGFEVGALYSIDAATWVVLS